MQFIPILMILDALVSGTLWSGAEPVGGKITFENATTTMSASVDRTGKYTVSLPPGTYDVIIERSIGGRRARTMYNGLTLADGANAIDLCWPSNRNADARTALVRQHFDAGKAASAAGRHGDAATHFMDALREDCSQDAVWSALTLSQAAAGNFEAAEKSHTTALAWGAGAATTCALANAYYHAGHFDKAGAKYEEAATRDSSKASTYLASAGAAYFAGKMGAQAEAAYKRAANAPGAAASSWYFWGVTAQGNGNREDALGALRAYLQADGSGQYAADARQRIAAMGG